MTWQRPGKPSRHRVYSCLLRGAIGEQVDELNSAGIWTTRSGQCAPEQAREDVDGATGGAAQRGMYLHPTTRTCAGAATARVEFAMPARRSATSCLSRTATAVAGSNEIKLRKNAGIISVALEFGPHSHKIFLNGNIVQTSASCCRRTWLVFFSGLKWLLTGHKPSPGHIYRV